VILCILGDITLRDFAYC